MQLSCAPNGKASTEGAVRSGLAAAACALLSALPHPTSAGQIEAANLVYTEPNRVTAVETALEATKEWEDGRSLRLRFVADLLTGASANGAVPAAKAQTFTRPSGRGVYTVEAGKTPLDPTFKDARYAGSATLVHPLGRLTTSNVGLNLSTERDYLSIGISAGISRDFAMRNTTLAGGLSATHDTVRPFGGAPDPLTPMGAEGEEDDLLPRSLDDEEGEGGESGPGKGKDLLDAMIGITQVLDRATIARVNYSVGHASGYLTDPYKIVSVVAGEDSANPGDPVEYLYEKRPDNRTKQSLYGELRRRIGPSVLSASYRYYWDSWDVRSSTVDLHFTQPLGTHTRVEPHLRYYHQRKARFFSSYLLSGQSVPSHASADYRLGTFDGSTLGCGVVRAFDSGTAIRFGIEYYLQQGDSSPPDAPGTLAQQELFPDVSAWMVRLGASVPMQW